VAQQDGVQVVAIAGRLDELDLDGGPFGQARRPIEHDLAIFDMSTVGHGNTSFEPATRLYPATSVSQTTVFLGGIWQGARGRSAGEQVGAVG
jgi:hypothetical protein